MEKKEEEDEEKAPHIDTGYQSRDAHSLALGSRFIICLAPKGGKHKHQQEDPRATTKRPAPKRWNIYE